MPAFSLTLFASKLAPAHFLQHLGDGLDGCAHIGRVDMTDAAHAKGFHVGQFARVQNETLDLDQKVERFELIARIVGGVEGGNDRRLDSRR